MIGFQDYYKSNKWGRSFEFYLKYAGEEKDLFYKDPLFWCLTILHRNMDYDDLDNPIDDLSNPADSVRQISRDFWKNCRGTTCAISQTGPREVDKRRC